MQVTDVSTFVVRNPPPSFGSSHFVVVRVVTADGCVGWGEMAADVVGHVAAPPLIADVADRLLVGHDPRLIEALWLRARALATDGAVPAATIGALSALEIACWDIAGRALERPVHELFGGRVRDRVRAATALYPSAGWREVRTNAEHAAARATNEVERGFSALIFDTVTDGEAPGGIPSQREIADTSQMMARVRSSIGPEADVVVRANARYGAAGATRLVHELEPFDPLCIDRPCSDDHVDALGAVASSSSTPVAAGSTLSSRARFASLAGAAGVWRPDIGRCGGLLAGRKIADLAETHGVAIAPVTNGGPILGAANLHLAAVTPNTLFVEGVREWAGIHADLLTTPIEFDDGMLTPPSGPGLGVELDTTVAARHDGGPAPSTPLPPPPG